MIGDRSGAASVAGRLGAALLIWGALSAPAQALFGDDEARKAILELRAKVAEMENRLREKDAELATRIERLEAANRAQMEFANTVDAQRKEIATLRGQVETLTNEVATLQKRNRDLYADLDGRLKAFEPIATTVDGKPATVDRAEQAAYDAALRTPDDAAGPPRELAGFVRTAGGRPETRLSRLSRGIVAYEILSIAIEIRGRQLAGEDITDLTVGDFDPRQFPIPERLTAAIHAALERGETNYPPPDGLPQLRQAVVDLFVRDLGLVYPLESVVITSGSRPAIYGTYLTVCDPGDRILYPVPSWNNDHYVHHVGGSPVEVPCGPEVGFLPTRQALRPHLAGTRLMVLCW